MEELEAKIAELEARIVTLEASAHSGHTIDAPALDTIATHVLAGINERLRATFGKKTEAVTAAEA